MCFRLVVYVSSFCLWRKKVTDLKLKILFNFNFDFNGELEDQYKITPSFMFLFSKYTNDESMNRHFRIATYGPFFVFNKMKLLIL